MTVGAREQKRRYDLAARAQRVQVANKLIETIASCGRRFFSCENGGDGLSVSRFELDARGRVFFIDKWRGRRIDTHHAREWRGFTEGGTLRSLVERLRDYIMKGDVLPSRFLGPWPEWYCGGDLWGYGADMQRVRDAAVSLGISPSPSPTPPLRNSANSAPSAFAPPCEERSE